MIASFPERTQNRIQELSQYMQEYVLCDGVFCCSSYKECRASRSDHFFYEGQLSHIGRNYDLEVNGRPMRIVIVGQEYGSGETCHDFNARYVMIRNSANGGFGKRNPHMRGTTYMLRLILGRDLGADPEGEQLLDGHIFDGFALINYLLCSALKEKKGNYTRGGAKGRSSSVMRRNCARHFAKTLEILSPTVIMIQGSGVRNWLRNVFDLPPHGQIKEHVIIGGQTVDMLTFYHPSAHMPYGWKSLQSDYLLDAVCTTIRDYFKSRYQM